MAGLPVTWTSMINSISSISASAPITSMPSASYEISTKVPSISTAIVPGIA